MRYLESIKEKFSALLPMWFLIMFIAIWSVVIQDGYINRDGLLYLKQAYLMAEGSWEEGLALYPWPFFSILIAVLHKLSGLHLQVVAHAVDLALFGIAAWFYLKILKLIYKQKHIIFYGGITLLSFIPIMDDYVGMVLRDHGLWAGCMIGTYFYFKNIKKYFLKNSLMWQLGFLFSGLFRPEGLIFLVLLPLWNLLQNNSKKLKQLVQDYSLCIISAILGLFAILLLNVDLINVISSSRLSEFLNRPVSFLTQLVNPLPIQTDNEYLSNLIENYSLVITYAVLISVLIFKWVKGMGIFHGGLFFYSFFENKRFTNDFQKYIYLFLIVSFILVSINLLNVYVLTNRYWGFHWWWVFILITPTLTNLINSKKTSELFKLSFFIIISVLILNTIIDKSDNLEKEVANFIRDKSIPDVHFIENERIKYYLNYTVSDILKSHKNIKFKYRLISSDNLSNHRSLVIKKFPDQQPKFILIKNVR